MTLFPYQQRVAANGARFFLRPAPSSAGVQVVLRRVLEVTAPTGSGKTRMMVEMVRMVTEQTSKIVWFWICPFATVIEQTNDVIAREAAGVLRRRNPATDRRIEQIRPGDIFLATTSGLIETKGDGRRVYQPSEQQATLPELIAELRRQEYRIGLIIDEAHHGMVKPGAASACKLVSSIVTPDFMALVTATPNDKDVRTFLQKVMPQGYEHENLSVSRADCIASGLIKPRIDSISFYPAHGVSASLVDVEATALRQAVMRHNKLTSELMRQGIAVAPLTLVQCASTRPNGVDGVEWTRKFLVSLGVLASAIATHTADEPDADLLTKSRNPAFAAEGGTEYILFKHAIAQGFDAPRAFIMVGLRSIRDEDFGLQILGRVMRQHVAVRAQSALLPTDNMLLRGYVILADPESQQGLEGAAEKLRQLTTDYNANETAGKTEVVLLSAEPQALNDDESPDETVVPSNETLLNEVTATRVGAMVTGTGATVMISNSASARVTRSGVSMPDLFDDPTVSETPTKTVTQSPGNLAESPRAAASVTTRVMTRRTDLIGLPTHLMTVSHNVADESVYAELATAWGPPDSAVASLLRQDIIVMEREVALIGAESTAQSQRVTDHEITGIGAFAQLLGDARFPDQGMLFSETGLSVSVLEELLTEAVRNALEQVVATTRDRLDNASLSASDTQQEQDRQKAAMHWLETPERLHIALRVMESRTRDDLRLLMREEEGRRLSPSRAAVLPNTLTVENATPLMASPKSVYQCYPPRVARNSWELAFARWCDSRPEVRWWHANEPKKPWSVSLVVPGQKDRFYPDFVVGVETPNGGTKIVLVDPKDIDRQSQAAKIHATHPTYGDVRLVVLTEHQGLELVGINSIGQIVPIGQLSVEALLR